MGKGKFLRFLLVVVVGSACLLLTYDAEKAAEASTVSRNVLLWDRGADGNYTINVCFKKSRADQLDTPDWEGDKSRAINILQQTWMASSAVNFNFSSSDCGTTVPSSWIPVEMRYNSSDPWEFWGWGAPGKGARGTDQAFTDTQVLVNYGSNYYEFDAEVVHEMGHALGFAHERDRRDFTECLDLNHPPCNSDSECSLNGIARCDLATHQCKVVRTPGADPLHLSKFWDLMSIMANWECDENRMHGNNYWELSAGDKLGVNMLYPKKFDRGKGSVASFTGFHTVPGLVVRNDGSLVTDWMAQGAHQDTATIPKWWVNGKFAGNNISLSAKNLSQGASKVKFSFNDTVVIPKGRRHTGNDTVIVDSNLHAALTLNISLAVYAYQ